MKEYIVRSGQNIYDIALTLYGSVEGLFDLLVCNPSLRLDQTLERGAVLLYHEEMIINQDIVTYFDINNIIIKNGEYPFEPVDAEELLQTHYQEAHANLLSDMKSWSPDEENLFWEGISSPKLIIKQKGILSKITFKLKSGTHILIDWGDRSECKIYESGQEIEVEHCYKGNRPHTITFYGECEFEELDIRECNGECYPLSLITADVFLTVSPDSPLYKLIKTR